ncbi:MAG: hypothetical protein JXA01_06970 [Dehalococcoidia bacterium]|nr:hypothetical protein [Dehalococcoidia bacterium]
MSENQKKILQMLADGKIDIDEAQKLLSLVDDEQESGSAPGSGSAGTKSAPRYLHIIVEPKDEASTGGRNHKRRKVNVRVPFGLIRAGMKLATLIPSDAAEHMDRAFKEKGFDFDVRRIKEEDLMEMISTLQENEIDVDSGSERVRLYAE